MEDAYKKIKEEQPDMKDLYILGSSRHELILIPDDVDSEEHLKAIHEEVQATVVPSADKLTENIYKVDAQSKQISIVDISSLTEGESIEKEVVKSHGKSH